ncbi:MAG: CDP-glycerol glycerophosphotransferase family protein [Clostridia bacterium]|nr:CDP-glycerol glycerophosphotransferase family protein [Clostridia bacterium]
MNKTLDTIKKMSVSLAARMLLTPMRLLPIRKRRVLFVSFRGKQYSCNPRAISECLVKKAGDRLEIAWAFHDAEKFRFLEKEGVKVLSDSSFEFIKYALTSRVIVTNGYYKPHLPRRRGQYFIRTWHGGGAYKRVGKAQNLPFWDRMFIKMQQQGANLYLSSSKAFTEMTIRDAFGYKGEILECGMPRNDRLVKGDFEDAKKRVYECLSIPSDVRVALYAPTYRDNKDNDGAYPDFDRMKNALEKRFGGKWMIAYRGHHVYYQNAVSAKILNASDYMDMQDLLLASDALFTDYSSSIWDMSLMMKPVFLFCTDLESYKSERDFFTDIKTWPFPLSENDEELEKAVLSFDENKMRIDYRKHHEALGSFESGNASEIAAERILKICSAGE